MDRGGSAWQRAGIEPACWIAVPRLAIHADHEPPAVGQAEECDPVGDPSGRPRLETEHRAYGPLARSSASPAHRRSAARQCHAQARRPLRRRQQRRRRDRERQAQGGDPAPALRDGRARPRPRSSARARLGTVVIRDSRDEAGGSSARCSRRQWRCRAVGGPAGRHARRTSPSGSLPFLDIGYRHLIAGFPSPHDEESMTRFATEVRPILERAG